MLSMTTTGDKSESGISLEKAEVTMFWLRDFGDLGMTKNNKGTIILKNCLTDFLVQNLCYCMCHNNNIKTTEKLFLLNRL